MKYALIRFSKSSTTVAHLTDEGTVMNWPKGTSFKVMRNHLAERGYIHKTTLETTDDGSVQVWRLASAEPRTRQALRENEDG